MIVQYYIDNRNKLVNRVKYRVGGIENAEDVVQEAFARALQYISTYDHDKPFGAWFNTILNNATRDFKREYRDQGRTREVQEGDFEPVELPEWVDLDKMLVGRNEVHKDILTLHFKEGFTPADIVKITEYQKGQVHMCIRRFVNQIQGGLKV
jgi:RNA polymerase sigma factor (sigma-70 family)